MTDKLFQGLITDEGIEKARDTQTTQGWLISPFEFYLAETNGEFVTSRTAASMKTSWHHGKFSAVTKQNNNKILLTITLAGDEDAIQRQIKEIYIKCKLPNGQEFLYALIQPLITMTFVPTVSQEMNFLITLSNTSKEDVYTIQYVDTTKLNSYQLVTEKGKKSGYCPLGANGVVPDDYLPLRDNLPIGTMVPIFCSKDYIPVGYLPCDGKEYTYGEFQSVYNDYLLAGKLPTCNYTEYQNSISTYGSCAKFGLDTANAKFKVPTIADGTSLQQAKSDSQLSALFKPGLPNITGGWNQDFVYNNSTAWGAIARGSNTASGGGGGSGLNYTEYTFDASRVNGLYGASNTVQPKAVSLRWFVLVTHGMINASITDWSVWINQLNKNTAHISDLYQWQMGQPIPMLTNDLPANCIRLEGASVLITDYPELWKVYGTTWGQVDNLHFTLPNLTGRTLWGGVELGYLSAGLPNITGYIDPYSDYSGASIGTRNGSGALYSTGSGTIMSRRETGGGGNGIGFQASRSNSIYGASNTVQPPAIKVRFITRYR